MSDNPIVKYGAIANHVFHKLKAGNTEYVFQRAMEIELRERGIVFESQKVLPILYISSKEREFTLSHEILDLYLPDERAIIELKVKRVITEEDENQVRKYQFALEKQGVQLKIGLIINFPKTNANDVEVKHVF